MASSGSTKKSSKKSSNDGRSSGKTAKSSGKTLEKKGPTNTLRKGDVVVKKSTKKPSPSIKDNKGKGRKEDDKKKKKASPKSKSSLKKKSSKKSENTKESDDIQKQAVEDSVDFVEEKVVDVVEEKVAEDPEEAKKRRAEEAIKREQLRLEVAASIVAATEAVAPTRHPAPSWKHKIASLKAASTHFKTNVIPSTRHGVLYDFTVTDSEGHENKVVVRGPLRNRRCNSDSQNKSNHLPLALPTDLESWKRVFVVCGLGITVYLVQLVVAIMLSFFLVLFFTTAIVQNSLHYRGHLDDPRLLGATACLSTSISLDSNSECDTSGMCSALYREDCQLPVAAAVADIVSTILLSLFLLFTLIRTAGGSSHQSQQQRLKQNLEMDLPNARDFTVQILNPPEDAKDPTEWYQFFNKRIGKVQNISVILKNRKYTDLLLRRRRLLRYYDAADIKDKQLHWKTELSLDETRLLRKHSSCFLSPIHILDKIGLTSSVRRNIKHMNRLCKTNKEILSYSMDKDKVHFGADRVYVTFEHQSHCHKCYSSKKLFRGKFSLTFKKPPEPEALRWQVIGTQKSAVGKLCRHCQAWVLTILAVVSACFVLLVSRNYLGEYWGGAFLLVDLALPAVFRCIVSLQHFYLETEDNRQMNLFFKLSVARVLVFSILLLAAVPLADTVEDDQIVIYVNILLFLCVAVPIIEGFDIRGKYRRWICALRHASNQDEVNYYWEASSDFIVAEHSSRVLSTICVCLLYVVVVPLSTVIMLASLLFTFLSNYYLIARHFNAVLIFRSYIANNVVVFMLVVLLIHSYNSSRLVYGWPFDEAYINEKGLVERVNKKSAQMIWSVGKAQWHSKIQTQLFITYKVLVIFLLVSVISIIFIRIFRLWSLKEWFVAKVFGPRIEIYRKEGQEVAYSGVQRTSSYCPLVRQRGDGEVVLCCDTTEMLPRYLPDTHSKYCHEKGNIALDLISADSLKELSKVKSFPYNMFSKFPILFDEGVYNSRVCEAYDNDTLSETCPAEKEAEQNDKPTKLHSHCHENNSDRESLSDGGDRKALNQYDIEQNQLGGGGDSTKPSLHRLPPLQHKPPGIRMTDNHPEENYIFYDMTRKLGMPLSGGKPNNVVSSSQLVSIDYSKRSKINRIIPMNEVEQSRGKCVDFGAARGDSYVVNSSETVYSRDQDSIGLLRL